MVTAGATFCVLGEHRARWLPTGDEAFAAMIALIDSAQHSVCLETYMVRGAGPAEQVRAALLRARARAVQVHVLYDAFGSEGLEPQFFAAVAAAGAGVRVYSPSRRLRLACRDHRKLLVVDEQRAIVGGFNIAPEYAGDGVTRGWYDLGLWIEGPVVGQLAVSFRALYALAPISPHAIHQYRRALRALLPPSLASSVSLLTSGPGWPRGRLRWALRSDLSAAVVVRCMAGYFLPPAGIRRSLRRCRMHGGSVQVLLAGTSDVPVARYAAEHLYGRMLAGGAQLFEYQPQVLHAKLLVLDDVVYVGSCNLDRRSLDINHELLLRLVWPELAAQARELFALALAHSRALSRAQWSHRRRWWARLRSRLAYWLLTRVDPLLARRRLRGLT